MNDESLHRQLRAFGVPTPTDTARTRAKHRALLALQQKEGTPESPDMPASRHHIWLGIVTVGLVVMAVTFWWWPRGASENLASDQLAFSKIVQLLSSPVSTN